MILLACLLYGCGAAPDQTLPGAPRVFLWAWERPEDLRFLDTSRYGVAFLAATIHLKDGAVHTEPRRQPLRLAARTQVIPVIRIDTNRAPLTTQQMDAAEQQILHYTARPRALAAQIDFDALQSERGFYRRLLERLGRQRKLSITALASWCLDDGWITGLPVAEAVPMLFRMGPEARQIRRRLAQGEDFRVAGCRHSTGFSTDEPLAKTVPGRRVYLFHPRPWSAAAVQAAAYHLEPIL